MNYRCILFDLDHTLWDYDTNSTETLKELYLKYDLQQKGISSFTDFSKAFLSINTDLWVQYDLGKIQRDVIRFERFHKVMLHLGVDDYPLSLLLSDDYVTQSPRKSTLMPNAIETLEYLYERYPMIVVTNGFEEIQSTKIAASGITNYFKSIVTSARAGYKKPAREIFEFALTESGFENHEAVMIGDNLLTDIGGARNAQVDTIFFNPHRISHQEKVKYEISDLKELMEIL